MSFKKSYLISARGQTAGLPVYYSKFVMTSVVEIRMQKP